MATATREELRQMVDDLPDTELDAARESLERLFKELEKSKYEAHIRRLLESGLLVSAPPADTTEAARRFKARKPIRIEGEPLSETIIRERR